MAKKSEQKCKYPKKWPFNVEEKAFFIIFIGLSVIRNFLTQKNGLLIVSSNSRCICMCYKYESDQVSLLQLKFKSDCNNYHVKHKLGVKATTCLYSVIQWCQMHHFFVFYQLYCSLNEKNLIRRKINSKEMFICESSSIILIYWKLGSVGQVQQ